MLTQLVIGMFSILLLKTLILYEDNKYETMSKFELIDQIGVVNLDETDMFVFYNYRHLTTGEWVVLDQELKTYMDVHFTQTTNDWN